ncbi:hypothetical protein KKD70_01835 [Patescibacteria group bacterium]|nr:hypothetical protein [Patescibacteria group bacterium]
MKKLIVPMILAMFVFTGCMTVPEPTDVSDSPNLPDVITPGVPDALEGGMPEIITYTYENEYFTLTLPAQFTDVGGSVGPVADGAFPRIGYMIDDVAGPVDQNDLLLSEEALNGQLCVDTNACAVISENENVTLGGVDGVWIVKEFEGRGMDDTEGFTREYVYLFWQDGKRIRLYTSATDLQDFLQIEIDFRAIVATVEFLGSALDVEIEVPVEIAPLEIVPMEFQPLEMVPVKPEESAPEAAPLEIMPLELQPMELAQ